ncbi:MAG: aminotransferase class I/II [Gammaproteobacteria bacterium]|nr:aminotransferase class I/II [Gammaproteobacteria bacterium]
MAPSKTFNLAGMKIANIIIPNSELREKWQSRNLPVVNPISLAAAQGVYENGGAWLDALRVYLDGNFAEVESFLNQHLSEAEFAIPNATYLAWIDLSAYFSDSPNLTRFFAENAGVILEGGEMFIDNGANKIRLNVACPRSVVNEGLGRILGAIREL